MDIFLEVTSDVKYKCPYSVRFALLTLLFGIKHFRKALWYVLHDYPLSKSNYFCKKHIAFWPTLERITPHLSDCRRSVFFVFFFSSGKVLGKITFPTWRNVILWLSTALSRNRINIRQLRKKKFQVIQNSTNAICNPVPLPQNKQLCSSPTWPKA